MDIVTLGAALNGSAEYVNSHFKGGSNIQIVNNPDGTQTINASGEVSSEDTVARAEIAAIKDGETLDSFGDVETALDDKADSTTTYTKTEVDTALSAKANSADVYSKSDIDTAMSAKADKSTTYTKTEVDTALGSKQNTISDLSTIRSGAALGATAVQPETGKGLSTNDYTTAEKTKLAGIAEGAEVNVQSNWTQTTTTADDYIKNKPTLGTAAAKNATDTYNATGTDVTTGKAVAAALATLPEPMVFQGSLGTGGTITTLPTASSSNKGDVYKVITAGTYASQSAKVGDTFISDGSTWVLIPSGDEPSGTVTNVAVANSGGLTINGSPITSSGTITVGHQNSVTAKTSSSLKKFTYDAYGHVTGSSELSTAESNALASGIDSTKVGQISTNQTNIGKVQTQANWNTNNGVKNFLNFDADTMKSINTGGTWSGNTWSLGNNVTLTINSDKSITLNGTANAGKTVYLARNLGMAENAYTLSTGALTTKLWAGLAEVGGTENNYTGSTTHLDKTCQPNHITLYVESGCTLSNFTIYPMLTLKSLYDADSTYQPYALPNTKITPELIELVDSGTKNELNVTATSSGICTVNSDGSITVNGTVGNADIQFVVRQFTAAEGVKLRGKILSGCPSGGGSSTYGLYLQQNQSPWASYGNVTGDYGSTISDSIGTTGSYLLLVLRKNQTISNVTFYPMICSKAAWDVSQKYVPYAMNNAELTTKAPVTLSKRHIPQSADYEIVSDLTISIPAGKKYLIHAMAMFNNVAPKGVIINKTNAIAANKNTVYAEITNDTNDFGGLTTSAIMTNTGSTAFDACIFAKFKAANASGSDVIVTYQDITESV